MLINFDYRHALFLIFIDANYLENIMRVWPSVEMNMFFSVSEFSV